MLEVDLISKSEQIELLENAREILRLLGAIRRTMKKKISES